MNKLNPKRFLASLLAVLMLSQVTGVAPGILAEELDALPQTEETQVITKRLQENSAPLLIKKSMTNEQVGELLGKALIPDYDELDDDAKSQLHWEYYSKGLYNGWWGYYYNDAWGSISGSTSTLDGYKYTHAALRDSDDGRYKVRLAGTEEEVTIEKISGYPTSLVLKEGVSVTYNIDADAMKREIVDSVIDYESSVLPEGTSTADFTVPKLNAGEKLSITIKYNGNDDYKPSSATTTITVNKANVGMSVDPFIIMYAGDKALPEGSVTLTPNDESIDVYKLYAGIESKSGGKMTTSVCIELPERITGAVNSLVFKLTVNPLFKGIFGRSVTDILENGITVGQLREYAGIAAEKAEQLKVIIDWFGVDTDSFIKLMKIINGLPGIADDLLIRFGVPAHAGAYQLFAVTNAKNYNTAVGVGTVFVKMRTDGMKLIPNEALYRNTITVSEAQSYKNGTSSAAALTLDGSADGIDQSSVQFWFTGMTTAYARKDFPTKPGKYIVTASVIGGDYYASPVTFTFRIVADR